MSIYSHFTAGMEECGILWLTRRKLHVLVTDLCETV